MSLCPYPTAPNSNFFFSSTPSTPQTSPAGFRGSLRKKCIPKKEHWPLICKSRLVPRSGNKRYYYTWSHGVNYFLCSPLVCPVCPAGDVWDVDGAHDTWSSVECPLLTGVHRVRPWSKASSALKQPSMHRRSTICRL